MNKTKSEDRIIAERMRRQATKDRKDLAIVDSPNTPANYLSPSVINSISSVKKDKAVYEKIIARELLDMIMNSESETTKLKAMKMYHDFTSSSRLLIKNGSSTTAFESDKPDSTISVNFSNHVKSDEPAEDLKVISRDLVKEKNDSNFEDADYEVIND